MKLLNVLYVTGHRTRIGTTKGSLTVHREDVGRSRIPIEQLEAIVLLGNAEITSPAMHTCAQRGIAITSLTRAGKVRFRINGGRVGNVHLRVRQLEAHLDSSHTAAIARSLVAGKLQNSRQLINRWIWDADGPVATALNYQRERITDTLHALAGASSSDRIRGIEGLGTYRYFRALSIVLAATPFRFERRSRRPPRDPANALMSFTYALLLNELTGALEAIGLDAQIGYLHRLRSGRPALALDLIEELRPAHADRFAVRLLRRRQLSTDDFVTAPGGACHLTDQGRHTTIKAYEAYREEAIHHPLLARDVPRWALPQIQATLMARHLRGDLDEYPPYMAVG